MDALEVKILREMSRGRPSSPFPSSLRSLRDIANRLGVDKDTIRNRIKNLELTGVLGGWHAMMNPNLLSMKATRIWLDLPSESQKEECIDGILKMANVRLLHSYIGGLTSFVIAHTDRESKESQTAKAARVTGRAASYAATLKFPDSDVTLSRSDWQIYKAIRATPQERRKRVAAMTGLSSRTIKRRMQRLTEGAALLLAPDFDCKKLDGVAAELLVRLVAPRVNEITREIESECDDSLIRTEFHDEPSMTFLIVCRNVSRAASIRKYAKSLPGVVDVRLDFVQDTIVPRDALQFSS